MEVLGQEECISKKRPGWNSIGDHKRRKVDGDNEVAKKVKVNKKLLKEQDDSAVIGGHHPSDSKHCSECDVPLPKGDMGALCQTCSKSALQLLISEPLTEKRLPKLENIEELRDLHQLVGHVLVVQIQTNQLWAVGEVGFFDPHRVLFRIDFFDQTQMWLPLTSLPYGISENINVFAPKESGWWPARQMRLNTVAQALLQRDNEMEVMVCFYGATLRAEAVCSWFPRSRIRCFDVFVETVEAKSSSFEFNLAIDQARSSMQRFVHVLEDAFEDIRREVQVHLFGKKWIGKYVRIVQFGTTTSILEGIIRQMEMPNKYFLEAKDSVCQWVEMNNDSKWIWNCVMPYSDFSMEWFLDPEAVLGWETDPELLTPSTLVVDRFEAEERCQKCLFPLHSSKLISCKKCLK